MARAFRFVFLGADRRSRSRKSAKPMFSGVSFRSRGDKFVKSLSKLVHFAIFAVVFAPSCLAAMTMD
jgi:hypothetical protein